MKHKERPRFGVFREIPTELGVYVLFYVLRICFRPVPLKTMRALKVLIVKAGGP